MQKAFITLLIVFISAETIFGLSGTSISYQGITWTFNTTYTYGYYANGDPWVLAQSGTVRIISISPPSSSSGAEMNGSMINPTPLDGTDQGYDQDLWAGYANYISSMNDALDVSTGNPLVLNAGDSLVSTISFTTRLLRPQLESASVLTAVSTAPPVGSFRPPYSGTHKSFASALPTKDNLRTDQLKSLSPSFSAPTLAEIESLFEYVWLDHVPNWLEERLGHSKMASYGRDKAEDVGLATLLLNMDFSLAEKETLLIRVIQTGIDLYGIALESDEVWILNGGHASGRLWPIIFAGILLDYEPMKNIRLYHPDMMFGEIDQTFYVTQENVDITHSAEWAPVTATGDPEPYEKTDIGMAEWGIEHINRPYRDNRAWGANYRKDACAPWGGQILASYIMGASDLWYHQALLDYEDRYVAVETRITYRFYGLENEFLDNMWNEYRSQFEPADSGDTRMPDSIHLE